MVLFMQCISITQSQFQQVKKNHTLNTLKWGMKTNQMYLYRLNQRNEHWKDGKLNLVWFQRKNL